MQELFPHYLYFCEHFTTVISQYSTYLFVVNTAINEAKKLVYGTSGSKVLAKVINKITSSSPKTGNPELLLNITIQFCIKIKIT